MKHSVSRGVQAPRLAGGIPARYIPPMRSPRITAVSVLLCGSLVVSLACDKSDEGRQDLQAGAAAALGEGKDDATKEIEEKEAAARREAFEKRKAKEAAEQAKLDLIAERLVGAPDKPHKELQAACDDYIKIYDEWIKLVYFDQDGFQLDFFDNKTKNLGVVMSKCAKLQSIPATDCMIKVIENALPREEFPEPDAKLIQAQPDYIFHKCIEKFAPDKV